MAQDIAIYLEGRRLTLYKDENISVTSKVTDINNISKVFADFSQSFTVPADPINNAIFQHFYDVDLFGTFNSNIRVNCLIELDTIPFKFGKLQLEGVTLDNKIPASYKVTFYGNIKQLDDKFKDDELNTLDFTEYNHEYSFTNVKNGLKTNFLNNGDLIYPLIGQDLWRYGGQIAYADISQPSGAIDFKELKPAIRVKRVLEKIEEKYGIKFVSKFFDRAPFKNLFLWCSKGKEQMIAGSVAQQYDFNSQGSMGNIDATVNTTDNTINWTQQGSGNFTVYPQESYILFVRGIPAAGYEGIPYKLKVYETKNGGTEKLILQDDSFIAGQRSKVKQYGRSGSWGSDVNYSIRITCEAAYDFISSVNVALTRQTYSNMSDSDFDGGAVSSVGLDLDTSVIIKDQMPAFKIKDFIAGLMKQYNLVIRPLSLTEFYIEPLEDFQDAGNIYDVTPYIDIDSIQVDRPKIFSEIAFKYQKTDAILGKRYRELFDVKKEFGYGDLRATYEIDNKAELKVELPFELMMFERLQDETDSVLTNIHVGSAIGEKDGIYEPVAMKPFMFYHCGIERYDAKQFRLGGDLIRYSNMIANHNDKIQEQITDGLTWGSSINSFTYEDTPQSLYDGYWSDYIESIYNLKQRKFSYKAILPPSIINNLRINDKLIINDHRYKIEDFTLNLTDGDCKFNLALDFPKFQYGDTLSRESLQVTPARMFYSFKIITKSDWAVSKIDTGDDVDWITIESDLTGSGNEWITFVVDNQPNDSAPNRGMIIRVTINGNDLDLPILQEGLA